MSDYCYEILELNFCLSEKYTVPNIEGENTDEFPIEGFRKWG
jgi:hypothetical protein